MIGSSRTAEEVGRAFPGIPIQVSGGERVLPTVGAESALVVATPGAEPIARDGYAAVLLLDGWALLGRAGLRAAEETLRRWMNAAALARPAPHGRVVVVADQGLPVVQALMRWAPEEQARREISQRAALGFPPASRMAAAVGRPDALADLLAILRGQDGLGDRLDMLGPVPLPEDRERVLLRVPRRDGAELASALKRALAHRSARKAAEPVRVELDPREPL